MHVIPMRFEITFILNQMLSIPPLPNPSFIATHADGATPFGLWKSLRNDVVQ